LRREACLRPLVLATRLLHLAGIALAKLLRGLRRDHAVRWLGAGVSLAGVVLMFA
jgi:hydrogenase/urease accessory protein HupE